MPDLSRRGFMAVTSALGAVVAANPFKKYIHKLVSYVQPPVQTVPGQWTPIATTCRECPAGCGMYQMHRDGRVTKAEGNPEHPINLGGLCARGQSSLQGLYDPDRVKGPLRRDRRTGALVKVSWDSAYREVANQMRSSAGRLGLISRLETGTMRQVMQEVTAAFGSDRLLLYEPYGLEPLRAANLALYGMPVIPEYHLDKSSHIISFGADFLETWASPVELARKFSGMHSWNNGKVGRFTYVGPRLSMTATNADDFLLVSPGREQWVALAILRSMAEQGLIRDEAVKAMAASIGTGDAAGLCGVPRERISAIARSFADGGIALAAPSAAVGPGPAITAVLAGLLNEAAGAVGTRIDFSRTHALSSTATEQQLETFLDSITSGDAVIIQQTNIAFTRPSARERLRRAALVVYLGTLPDETAEIADWVLPVDSPLEAWGDHEPYTGVHGILQPTMVRLWDTRGAGEVLMELAGAAAGPSGQSGGQGETASFEQRMRNRWSGIQKRSAPGSDFDGFFTGMLRHGFLREELPPLRPSLRQQAGGLLSAPAAEGRTPYLKLWVWPSIMFYDGRTANRGWIQEAPDPVSYASWSSWVDLHPKTAASLGVKDGEVVELAVGENRLQAPVRISTEIAESVAGMTLGQGHQARGLSVAGGVGANPFLLVDPKYAGTWNFPMVSIRATGRSAPAVYTSPTKDQQDRDVLKWITASELRQSPAAVEEIDLPTPEGYDPRQNLYPPHEHRMHRWAMVIDLQKCIGCGACAVACYAENNIPVMGRKNLRQGREMAWLKVVPYLHPRKLERIGWLPLPCQHCDAAPCEPVCPVYAAVHNEEGLNAQIYNRCIGTRYCSNNCPYKVRRFNWFDPVWKKPLELQLNPEVTVRCRGVMEKCTFCVQRIRSAEYTATVEDRPVREGEIVPACMQTCPTGAYSFGDLKDPNSEVMKRFRSDPRRYQVLHELNTKSAVLYLKRIDQD